MLKCPEAVLKIIETLESAGYEAWVVGGCVRDVLLDREPQDWDITTDALPEAVQALFEATVPTGLRHGTVTVLIGHKPYEVTTYRTEAEYSDRRRPDSVEFVKEIEEDLARRDFTINAMAWHPTRGLKDCFNGREDLSAGVLRTVGDPVDRFREDPLRMLRGVRFCAQLDLEPEPVIVSAIRQEAEHLQHISAERIASELDKWITAPHTGRWHLLRDTGLMAVVLPELDRCFDTAQNHPRHTENVGEHCVRAASLAPAERGVRWALLLHDIGKPDSASTDASGTSHFYGHGFQSEHLAHMRLNRLKFDNDTKHRILHLIRHHDRPVEPALSAVRRAVVKIGPEIFSDWLTVRRCDLLAQNLVETAEALGILDAVAMLYDEVVRQDSCISLRQMALNGNDLIAMGMPPGPEIGRMLQTLLEWVLDEPERNTPEALRAHVQAHLGQI